MNSVSSLFALLKNRFYELVLQPKFDDLLLGYGFSQFWHNLWEYLDDDELMGNQDTVTILFEFLFRYLDNNCLFIKGIKLRKISTTSKKIPRLYLIFPKIRE